MPVDERFLAKLARKGGTKLLDLAVKRLLPAETAAKAVAEKAAQAAEQAATETRRKTSLTGKLAGAALVRIGTRSVPGAILVGGGLLAKTLHDRRKARRAADKMGGKSGVKS